MRLNERGDCRKCKGSSTTRYDQATDTLRKRCMRCGYSWNEACADSKEIGQAEALAIIRKISE